jgi:hypothetical protein
MVSELDYPVEYCEIDDLDQIPVSAGYLSGMMYIRLNNVTNLVIL